METLPEFHYLKAHTVAEAASFLGQYNGKAKLIAGGTDLLALMKDSVLLPEYLIDLKRFNFLDHISWDGKQGLQLGALTLIETILESQIIKDKYPALYRAAKSFGTPQIRNMATVGGNICHSQSSADMVPPLIAYGASIKLVGASGERTVLLEKFFSGPGQNIAKGEVLTEIIMPPPVKGVKSGFEKMAKTYEAKANCAVWLIKNNGKCEDIRIALGAVAPTVVRARHVETALKGKVINEKEIDEASAKIKTDISPTTDCRANASYRSYISQVLIKRLLKEALEN